MPVLALLTDCRTEEKLGSYQEYFARIGEHRLAKEYGQVYGLVTELLKRLSDLLGEECVSRKEYLEILDAGFAELKVGVIPAVADRVVVGDITRTRLAHIKVLFFAGVNDGIVPARKEKGSLLSDRDREFLGEHHMELAPTAKEESFQQRFYLYLMMTKPSKQLVLSCAVLARMERAAAVFPDWRTAGHVPERASGGSGDTGRFGNLLGGRSEAETVCGAGKIPGRTAWRICGSRHFRWEFGHFCF